MTDTVLPVTDECDIPAPAPQGVNINFDPADDIFTRADKLFFLCTGRTEGTPALLLKALNIILQQQAEAIIQSMTQAPQPAPAQPGVTDAIEK